MRIYTKTGDDGTTALFGGKRVLKCHELVEVYGSIDELNSWLGYILTSLTDKKLNKFLTIVQSDLFSIGSTLAGWKGDITHLEKRVGEMEKLIDSLDKKLPELTNFILPGGSVAGSRLHIARSIARRVERQAVKIHADRRIIMYLNRLSDALFILARFINKKSGLRESIWQA